MSGDDFWELSNLVARYAELLNLGQVEEVGALFEHGRISSSNQPQEFVGPAAVIGMYRRSVIFPEKVPDTLVFTSNLQLRVDGDTAFGKAYFMAVTRTPSGVTPVLAGRYHDEFRRIEGRWWFHHRHMLPDLAGDLSSHLAEPLEGV